MAKKNLKFKTQIKDDSGYTKNKSKLHKTEIALMRLSKQRKQGM